MHVCVPPADTSLVSVPSRRPHSLLPMPLSALEKPMAVLAFSAAVLTVVWKTVGVSWIPGFGPAWDACFTGGPQALYPRRASAYAPAWGIFYLLMYGGLGSIATFGGLQLSFSKASTKNVKTDENKAPMASAFTCTRAHLYGFFHLMLAVHHLGWSITQGKQWGRLEVWRFSEDGMPYAHVTCAVASVWLLFHAYKLLTTTKATPTKDVIRRKTVMDTVSVATFVQVLYFTLANGFGWEISSALKRQLWAYTFYVPAMVLVLDAVLAKSL